MSPTDWPISVRIVGTVASTTPTANSAKPTAKAGRSIASRQSRGCRGAGRACPGFAFGTLGAAGWPRSTCQRRIRAASKPELAAASGCLAVPYAGPDRILSRIRCKASGLGST